MLLSSLHNTQRGDTDPTDSLSILLMQAGESRQIEIKAGESFARMPASVCFFCFVLGFFAQRCLPFCPTAQELEGTFQVEHNSVFLLALNCC